MRFAYVTSQVPLRSYSSADPLDADWILENRDLHEVQVWVDEEGPGTDLLRSSGIVVTTSPQRSTDLPGLGPVSADHVQATLIAKAHEEVPFEAVVYGSDATVDLSWFEPALADLPIGVVLGGGILDLTRLVCDDPGLAISYGRSVWASASFAASADFLVSAIQPADLGLAIADIPIWNPLPDQQDTPHDVEPDLVAVIATGEDRVGLISLMSRVAVRVPPGASTTYVVIVPDLVVGTESTGDLVLAGCPADVRLATIIVSPGNDGVASEFIERADMVLAMQPQDAAIPATRWASHAPVILLEGARRAPTGIPSNLSHDARARVLLIEVDGSLSEAATTFDDTTDIDLFVLHTRDAGLDAARFLNYKTPVPFDLGVLGRAHPITGAADLEGLSADVLAVSADVAGSLARWMDSADSIADLVRFVARPALAHRLDLAVVPAVTSRRFVRAADVEENELPEWTGSGGSVPRIHSARSLAELSLLKSPAKAPRPKKTDARMWARKHKWTDRIRLALPWKGGWLERAMRGRW